MTTLSATPIAGSPLPATSAIPTHDVTLAKLGHVA